MLEKMNVFNCTTCVNPTNPSRRVLDMSNFWLGFCVISILCWMASPRRKKPPQDTQFVANKCFPKLALHALVAAFLMDESIVKHAWHYPLLGLLRHLN